MRLYFFQGRRTGIVANSVSEARRKKKRGGSTLVSSRALTPSERRQARKGTWIRGYKKAGTRAPSSMRGKGPRPKKRR